MQRKKIYILLYSFYIILSMIEFIYLFAIVATEDIILLLKLQFVFLYLFIIFTSIKYLSLRKTDLYILFLVSFGVFILSRIFLDLFGLLEFEYFNFFTSFVLSKEQQKITLIYLILSLSWIHWGFLLSLLVKFSNKNILQPNKALEKYGTFLFVVGLPGALYKTILSVHYVLTHGYLSLYLDTTTPLVIPIWATILGLLFTNGFLLIIASLPSKRKILFVLFIFFLFAIAKIVMGARGSFIGILFFIVWYYSTFYTSKEINIFKILISTVGLIFLSIYIGFARVDQAFSFTGFSDIFILFFSNMGGSLGVLANMVAYDESFINKGLPYILNPFITIFAPAKQSLERLEATPSLADHLSYFLDSERYLGGEGVGTSFLGELYDLGVVGFVLGSFLIGCFIVFFQKEVKHNRLLLVLSYHIVTGIIWMSRGSYFPPVVVMSISIFFYLSFFFLKKISHTKGSI